MVYKRRVRSKADIVRQPLDRLLEEGTNEMTTIPLFSEEVVVVADEVGESSCLGIFALVSDCVGEEPTF